jgi:hypothetical protein
VRLRSVAVLVAAVLAAAVLPVLAQAQRQAPPPQPAHASLSIPQNVLRTRAREHLDRAAAFVAMAREAPAAATDPASAHRASALAHESATAYRSALAEFAKGAYQKVSSPSLRSIGLAQEAIASASAAAAATTNASTTAGANSTTVVESVSGGDVVLGASADVTPDGSPAPVVRTRYHGPGEEAPPRPANWRVLGAVPFGTEPVHGIQPNGVAGLNGYATPAPFGVVSPVQQPPFQPAG